MPKIEELKTAISKAEGSIRIGLRLDLAFESRIIDPELSLKQSMKALDEARAAKDTSKELRALYMICLAGLYSKSAIDTNKWIDELVEKGINYNKNKSVGRAYILKYRMATRTGKLIIAADFLTKALEFFNEKEDAADIATSYNGLGNLYNEMKLPDQAMLYYHKALPFARKVAADMYNKVLQNIALMHVMLMEFDKAWSLFHEILDHVEDTDIDTRRLVLLNLGHICQQTEEYEQALSYLDESLKISEINYPAQFQIRPLCNKAMVLETLSRHEEALSLTHKAEKIALKDDIQTDLIEVYNCYAVLYDNSKQYEKQCIYLKKLVELKDQIIQDKSYEKVSEFENRHQINLYKERNRTVIEQNENLKSNINELMGKNQELETKLLNALSTIKEKDDLLTAHHRLASIGEMVSIVAHQWQQPLSVINAIIFSIQDSFNFNELTAESLESKSKMVEDLVKYLAQTLNDFRNFFKEQKHEHFTAESALDNALTLMSYALEKDDIIIVKELNADIVIFGSPNELVQVFLNLINNARDALLSSNCKKRELQISTYIKEDKSYIKFYDNGGPVPAGISDKLFQPYVTTKGEKGTGLGLNICKTIIEDRFSGNIWHENTKDGVSFIIELPAKQDQQQQIK